VVIHLPHISNFDDADPLKMEPGVRLRFINQASQLGSPAAIILPGTKNTLYDLAWLYQTGLADMIKNRAAQGTAVVGLCGGYQILGQEISDDLAVESNLKNMPGLGLLNSNTQLESQKTITHSQATLINKNGFWKSLFGETIKGYEIHNGQSQSASPLSRIELGNSTPISTLDGCCSTSGKIWGTYLHGIFENDHLRSAWLESLGVSPSNQSFSQKRIQSYDLLADTLENSLDILKLDSIIKKGINP
jgi:adenosylcobyric acid synthase